MTRSPATTLSIKPWPLVVACALLLWASPLHAANGDMLGISKALDLRMERGIPANAKPKTGMMATPVTPPGILPGNPPVSSIPGTTPAPGQPHGPPATPQDMNYSSNLLSDVFGAQLFTGAFSRQGATQFNPDYAIASGDNIQVRFWGAFEFDNFLTVDPKGNVFLPHVGPVQVRGVRNQELQRVLESAVRKVFRANVFVYGSLAAAQPVRVFVSGFVHRPGLYNGTSMDSILHYIDQAGGIDPERGSFLKVQIKRGESVRAAVNLYDFLLNGELPLNQLADGDVIFVMPRQHTIRVTGLVANAKRFEISANARRTTVADLVKIAKPMAEVTHVRVTRNAGTTRNMEYHPLEEAAKIALKNGDELEFTADKKIGTITVRVEGEHQSPQEYVLPHGARMADLLKQIEFSDRSDAASLQLFRRSVKERQKQMLQVSLKSLESTVLTARSGTSDEAILRKEEADIILQWVERAKQVEPVGQVLIAQTANQGELPLENGDILNVPAKDGLVLISGEVLFPNAIAFDSQLKLSDYIDRAGGYTQNADTSRIVVAHRDGSFLEGTPSDTGESTNFFGKPASPQDAALRPGDEILVLPKVDIKSRQIFKDLTQILYQVAIGAKVVLGL